MEEMMKKMEEYEEEKRGIIRQRKNAEIVEQVVVVPKSRTRIKNVKSGKGIEGQ